MSACSLRASACERKQKGKNKTEKRGRKGLSSDRNTRAQGGERVCKKNVCGVCIFTGMSRRFRSPSPLSRVYTDRVLWFQPDE